MLVVVVVGDSRVVGWLLVLGVRVVVSSGSWWYVVLGWY